MYFTGSDNLYQRGGVRYCAILKGFLLFMARSMMTLSLVEDVHFLDFLAVVDPRVNLPCRNTLTNNYLPQLYAEAVELLLDELKLVSRVALTTDGWTDGSGRSFITVTVHYIYSSFVLISRILSTPIMPESHTA